MKVLKGKNAVAVPRR